jgi:hypothetical protein
VEGTREGEESEGVFFCSLSGRNELEMKEKIRKKA